MKDKPSEWVAISDLMAGVMAVVMLLLVVAVLQKSANELKYQQDLAKAAEDAKKNRTVTDPMAPIKQALEKMERDNGVADLMIIDIASNRLTLADSVFERGSACLKSEAIRSVGSIKSRLLAFLEENKNAQIFIEGYTDNVPVKRPVTDFERYCTVYDDNYTLSAARAREVRKALVGTLDEELARRIVVAGYGDSKPIVNIDPADPKNRRVEVRFLIDDRSSHSLEIQQIN